MLMTSQYICIAGIFRDKVSKYTNGTTILTERVRNIKCVNVRACMKATAAILNYFP